MTAVSNNDDLIVIRTESESMSLEISILTLCYNETCIVIRKSSHVRDIDS